MTEYDSDFDMKGNCDKLLLVMQVLSDIEVEKIVATVSMAHTMGPFIDPTKYRDALYRGDMDILAELAEALKEPIKIYKEKIEPKIPTGV